MSKNREYKSDLFSMLLQEPENALSIYNALNNTNYRDATEVEILQLDKGISLSVRHDAAFVINCDMSIYEHQSTYNPNMPLRSLIYVVNNLDDIIKNRDVYSRHLVRIPTPHFVVFYNGREERPEKEIMRLSDAFCHPTDEPELELKCTVYNISPGCNRKLLEACPVLREYMAFIEKARQHLEAGEDLEQALEQTIRECIRENILADFLKRRGNEVKKTMTLDYTWERREGMIRQEERAYGRDEGRAEGIAVGVKRGREEGIAVGVKRGRAEGIIKISMKYHASEDAIITELMTELQISPEQAREYLEQYGKSST